MKINFYRLLAAVSIGFALSVLSSSCGDKENIKEPDPVMNYEFYGRLDTVLSKTTNLIYASVYFDTSLYTYNFQGQLVKVSETQPDSEYGFFYDEQGRIERVEVLMGNSRDVLYYAWDGGILTINDSLEPYQKSIVTFDNMNLAVRSDSYYLSGSTWILSNYLLFHWQNGNLISSEFYDKKNIKSRMVTAEDQEKQKFYGGFSLKNGYISEKDVETTMDGFIKVRENRFTYDPMLNPYYPVPVFFYNSLFSGHSLNNQTSYTSLTLEPEGQITESYSVSFQYDYFQETDGRVPYPMIQTSSVDNVFRKTTTFIFDF